MERDPTNPSRDGKRWVSDVLAHHVKGMISDCDYDRVRVELIDIIRAERRLALASVGKTKP